MTTGKSIGLTGWTFVGKVISLLFNMLSSLVITFLPGSKRLNFMAAVTICSDFGAPQNKGSHCCHCFPIYLSWSDENRCHDFSFLNVENFFSLLFHFHQKALYFFFTFCTRVVSSTYPRLLIFLLAILIPGCASPCPAFLTMCSPHIS